ncbi:MAG: hypothetical protein HS120_04355 [Burkholderiales bacterium]|nr:hypothetical protein [Burkholderiales bacterium]
MCLLSLSIEKYRHYLPGATICRIVIDARSDIAFGCWLLFQEINILLILRSSSALQVNKRDKIDFCYNTDEFCLACINKQMDKLREKIELIVIVFH